MLSGAAPTLIKIASRERTARLLCDLAAQVSWSADDRKEATEFKGRLARAARHCEEELPDILKQRKKPLVFYS